MTVQVLFDEEAERSVLDVIAVRADALDEVAELLEPESFGRQHHGAVFTAMRRLHAVGQPIDPLTISAQLERDGQLETVGRPFVYSLGTATPRGANIAAYANVVRDKALVRQVCEVARRTLEQGEREMVNGQALLDEAESAIFRLTQRAVKSEFISGQDLAAELYGVLERLAESGGPVLGIETGFRDLDRMTRGLQPGDLILVGARPSMGKTALALQVALHAAQAHPVAFLSVEMGRQPLGLRGVIALSQVDGWRLLGGRLNDVEHHRAGEGLSQLGLSQIYIDESPQVSPLQVRSKLRRLAAHVGPLGLVVIDYLQLLAPVPEDRRENKTNQVAGISRALKILAREFATPFLVLSQLNRGLEKQSDKRPTMADLRDSGALEQDADLVLLLHRPEVYDKSPDLAGVAELVIAKHRNGPTGIVDLMWRGPQMRFESRSRA